MTKGKIYQINYTDTCHPFASYHGKGEFIERKGDEFFFKLEDGQIGCFYEMDFV